MPTSQRRVREALGRALVSATTLDEQLGAADAVLRDALSATFASWGTVDPATMLSTSCTVAGEFGAGADETLAGDARRRELRLFALEWEGRDPLTFTKMMSGAVTAAGLRATVGDPAGVARYRDLLRPLGLSDELRLLCAADGMAWATAIFYRADGVPFDERDVAMAAAVATPLARAFRRSMLDRATESADLDAPPGALLVGSDGSVLTTSAAAEDLLDGVAERDVHTTLIGLAARVEQVGDRAALARIRGRHGWVVLHASPAKGLDGAVSVVVERPRPVELAPLIMSAIGLTPRERQVVERSLAGATRGQIARALRLSEETVGDHLTSAYRKAGVANRAELSAMLFGRFYDEPRSRHTPPSPYGYLLPVGQG